MKIKTFKLTDEKEINEFINDVAIIQNGITVNDNSVTIVYRENKYPEYTNEILLQGLHGKLYEEKQTLDAQKIELLYADTKEVNEQTGVTKRAIEEKIKDTENMIELLEKQIAINELA